MTTVVLVGSVLLGALGCPTDAVPDGDAAFEARLESILLEPDPLDRARQFAPFLEDLQPGDAARVRAVFGRMWQYVGSMETLLFASWWARVDPLEALKRLREGAFSQDAELAFGEIIRTWARNDPEAARGHLARLGTRYPQETALISLVRGWAESGEDGLWAFLEGFPKGVPRQKAIEAGVDHMVLTQGVEATVAFVEALPDDGKARFKLQVARRVAAALVLRDPEFAAAWAEGIAERPFGNSALEFVVTRWAQFDAEATLEWLAGLAPDPAQVHAIELAYNMWLRRDPARAMAWVGEQPAKASLDPVRALYAAQVAADDIETAVAVLDSIEDPERHSWAAIQVGRAWVEADRSAALAWLEQAELGPKERDKILDPDPTGRLKRRARARERRSEGAAKARTPSDAVEGPLDVGDQVGRVLDADRVADQ